MTITLDHGTVTCQCGQTFPVDRDANISKHLRQLHNVSPDQARDVLASLRRTATFKQVVFS